MSYRLPMREVEVYLRRQSDGSIWRPDAALMADVDRRYNVTEHPVENSQSVTDHVQALARGITLTCVVTELPDTGTGGPFRVRDRVRWLEETGAAGERVDIVTRRHGVFLGYVLRGSRFGIDGVSRLQFDLEFREVRIASVTDVTIAVEDVSEDVAVGAPDEVDNGEQATTSTDSTTATQTEAEGDQSLLSSLLEAL